MGFLFGKSKIQGDELCKCLAYFEEECKLSAFQEKEADSYNKALVKYGSLDNNTAVAMCQASNRLVQAASEILRRRSGISSVPDAASAMYSAWQSTYTNYLAWTKAQAAVMQALANGTEPDVRHSVELLSKSENCRKTAMDEERKLLKRLDISGEELQELFNRATNTIAEENWQPY